MNRSIIVVGICLLLGACAGPTVTRTQALPQSADAPYGDVLVISVFLSYDLRREFEREIVKQLRASGVEAIASTSKMDVKTPVTRDNVLALVEELGSDAVLISQLLDFDTQSKLKNRRPEATYNFRPTYYVNVWSVELAEYSEPQGLELKHELSIATQVFSVRDKEPVWAMETHSKLKRDMDGQFKGTSFPAEAKAIVSALKRDNVVVK